jgi:hypothetical protein
MLVNNYQHMRYNNTEEQRPSNWILHQQAVWAKDRWHWSNAWKQNQRLLFPWFLALITLQFKILLHETNLQYYGILMGNNVGQLGWVTLQHFVKCLASRKTFYSSPEAVLPSALRLEVAYRLYVLHWFQR